WYRAQHRTTGARYLCPVARATPAAHLAARIRASDASSAAPGTAPCGILQVLRYSGGLAEQMATASKLMLEASQQQQRDRLIQAQRELQRLVEQLQRYLRQFSDG